MSYFQNMASGLIAFNMLVGAGGVAINSALVVDKNEKIELKQAAIQQRLTNHDYEGAMEYQQDTNTLRIIRNFAILGGALGAAAFARGAIGAAARFRKASPGKPSGLF